jgi:acyl-CoA thioester hydrolase
MSDLSALVERAAFATWTQDIARYGDTDRQGHLNNAVFSTFLESGRVALLYDPVRKLVPPAHEFVIVRLTMDFRAEMSWGGAVEIGTVVRRLGRSSFVLGQGIFQGGVCAATAETIMVLVDDATRRAVPLAEGLRAELERYARA